MNYQKAIKSILINDSKNKKTAHSQTTAKHLSTVSNSIAKNKKSHHFSHLHPELYEELINYYHNLHSTFEFVTTSYAEKRHAKQAKTLQDIPEQILKFIQQAITTNTAYNKLSNNVSSDNDKAYLYQQILIPLTELYQHSGLSTTIFNKMITQLATSISIEMKQAEQEVPELKQTLETLIPSLQAGRKCLQQSESAIDEKIIAAFNIDEYCEKLYRMLNSDEHVHTQYKNYKQTLNTICTQDQQFNKVIEENGGQNANWVMNVLTTIYILLIECSNIQTTQANAGKNDQSATAKTSTLSFFQEETPEDDSPTVH